MDSTEKWFGCYEGNRDGLFLRESNRHPAKMAVLLCFRIFEHGERMGYWKRGDTILDPMAGIGTTLICGAMMGYRVIGVELEPHFIELANASIIRIWGKFRSPGSAWMIHGDARNLKAIDLDAAITSPPYGGALEHAPGPDHHPERCNGPRGGSFVGYDAALSSPPYADQQLTGQGHFRSAREPKQADARENPRERYDGVVSSPPYGDLAVMAGAGVTHAVLKIAREQGMEAAVKFYRATVIDTQKAHGRWSNENIQRHIEMALATAESGGYASGVSSSPPYSEALSGGGIAKKDHFTDPKLADRQYMPEHHGKSPAQIGNLRDPKNDIDAVLSSPPWENQTHGGQQGWSDPEKAAAISAERYRTGERKGHPASAAAIKAQMERDDQRVYGDSEGQIGNSGGETYLAAMRQVYSSLHAVLKAGGVVALVTKNPVKNKQIRRLDIDTIRLMEACGFKLIEHKFAMLSEETVHGDLFQGETRKKRERKSFFKRLHEKKHPELAVDCEDVLFFRKI